MAMGIPTGRPEYSSGYTNKRDSPSFKRTSSEGLPGGGRVKCWRDSVTVYWTVSVTAVVACSDPLVPVTVTV